MGDLLCSLDPGGSITRTNAVWAETLGPLALSDPFPFSTLAHPDDRATVASALTQAPGDENVTASEFECRLRERTGVYHPRRWKIVPYGAERLLIGRDLTEQRKAEHALGVAQEERDMAQQGLSDAYQKLTFYMMNSPLAFVEWDRDLRVSYWSPEAERAFGWTADEVLDRHPRDWAFLTGEDAPEFLGIIGDLITDTRDRSIALSRHNRPDGSSVLIEWYHAALRDADGQTLSVFSLALDVTERKRAEAELLKIRKAVESASDAISIADMTGAVIHVNRSFTELFGYSLTEIGAGDLHGLLPAAALTEEIAAAIAGERSWRGESELRDSHGSPVPVNMRIDAIRDEEGKPIGRITVCTDLRERKQAERELVHQATHDALTGLPNRSHFAERLSRVFSAAQRGDALTACLFIDLDNFKVINDSLGHEAGDGLLKTAAERLQSAVRPEDLVARLGGDEFVVLIEDIVSHEQAAAVATRIAGQLRKPVSLAGRQLFVTASIGIATSRTGHERPDDILRDADVAMYQAKSGGKGGFVLFDPSMNAEAMDRLELEMDLRQAVERGELAVYFQPIIHLDSSRITEVEALMRWQHPQRGLIGPAKFIPIAEEAGLIGQIGEWILEKACMHGREWLDRDPDQPPIVISVNLSTRQLQQEDIVERVRAILDRTGLPAKQLKLEITESVMMLDADVTLDKLHALKALGVRLAVDDFGTGYSSMAYLSSLPVDTLKIDRAFIRRLGQTSEDDAIVRAIMTMAKTMGLFVTAEGIESLDQLGELRSLGCDRGQGYLFAKPLTLTDFEEMLHRSRLDTPAGDTSEEPQRCAA